MLLLLLFAAAAAAAWAAASAAEIRLPLLNDPSEGAVTWTWKQHRTTRIEMWRGVEWRGVEWRGMAWNG